MEEIIYTTENTIISSAEDKARHDAKIVMFPDHHEGQKRAHELGKRLIKVCCSNTAAFFEEALKIGMTETDKEIFLKSFYFHEFVDCRNW